MSFIKSIRTAIAQAIAPKTVITEPTIEDHRAEQRFQAERIASRVSQYAPTEVGHQDVTRGNISVNDVNDFVSDYAKSAIASLGSWSALAKGFNAYSKNPKDVKIEAYLSEFHAWNAVNPNQMDEEQVLDTIARLSQVKPATANNQTDAIIARVRKISVDQLRAEREAKAKLDTNKREELIEQFATIVWSHVFSEHNFEMPAHKAELKLISVMEWVAGWQSNNPAAQAAELLLLEDDLKQVRIMAKRDVGNNDGFVDGTLTADHMMLQNERQ